MKAYRSLRLAVFAHLMALAVPLLADTGPSLEEVLSKHAAARGGTQAWQKVSALRLTGRYSAFGYSSPFTLVRQRPSKLIFRTTTKDGAPWASAFDGELAWTIDPWLGTPWPTEMNTVEAAVFKPEADFDGPLVDPEAKGLRIELAGREDFDGIDTFKLVVTRANGAEEQWYLSSETFLEVARIAPAADFGQPIEAGRTYFLDFRPVSGLMIPHRIEKEYGIRFRSYDVDSVEVNPELTADTFSFPRPEAMADLPVRSGAWRVDVEWPTPRPGAPWAKTTTSAMIEELFHGALLEAELTFDQAGDIRRLRHTWSHDRFRNTYLETVFDNLTFRHTLLEGALTDGTLVTSTLDTGTVLDLGGQQLHLRQATSRTDTEGFQILQETSADGGETWQEALRLTFTPSTTATDEPEGR